MSTITQFKFIADALNGSGGFISGDYLIQYPRESNGKFERRKQIAWYRNFLRSACSDFVGYLAKRPPTRQTRQPLYRVLIDDADGKGNALDVFWQLFMIEAKARGSMLLVVDMPKRLPDNQAQQLQQRAAPYLVSINPEQILEYRTADNGLVEFLEIPDEIDGKSVIRGWDSVSWWVRDGDDIIESSEHGIGECPVLAFTESGDFPMLGEFAQIAGLSRRHYNLCSERDEILRSQTFSLLTYQVPVEQSHVFDSKKTAEEIGTHNMLIHQGDAPAFIAPPDGPATIYSNVISELEQTIKRIALTIEQPTHQESGVALTIRFQQLNSALSSFARKMEDLERRVWWIASRWLGLREFVEVSWSKDYSLADTQQELTELQQLQGSAFPPEVIEEKQKQIVGLMLSNLSPDRLEELMQTIGQEHSS